jgi:hypothetical protein
LPNSRLAQEEESEEEPEEDELIDPNVLIKLKF